MIPKLLQWMGRSRTQDHNRRRKANKARAEVEALEGRQVLSHLVGHGLEMAHHGHHGQAIALPSLRMERSHEVIRAGIAVKAPQFYEFYTGRMDPGLNARLSTARVSHGSLVLTGVMQGPINTSPTGEDQESYFVFGVNRGTGSVIAPFPNRPNVIFDSVVSVNVEEEGITGTVTDFTKPRGEGTTTLPADSVRVRGAMVRVSVPLSLLEPTAARPVNQWGINLWPRSELPPADFHTVASFVPEDATFPVAVPGRSLR